MTSKTQYTSNFEKTFIMVKPDGVQRGLVGEIIKRFEQKGYFLCGLKQTKVTKAFAEKHYADLSSKGFFDGLTNFLSSGPVVAMCWAGKDACKMVFVFPAFHRNAALVSPFPSFRSLVAKNKKHLVFT